MAMKSTIHVEYMGKKLETKDLMDEFKLIWKENGRKINEIETLELYYKPEEAMCYYVVNTTQTGSFPMQSK